MAADTRELTAARNLPRLSRFSEIPAKLPSEMATLALTGVQLFANDCSGLRVSPGKISAQRTAQLDFRDFDMGDDDHMERRL